MNINLIRRVSDDLAYDDSLFTKIAESMKKNQMKLFSVVNSEMEAEKIRNDLNGKGYLSKIEKTANLYNVFYEPVESRMEVTEDLLQNHFKNIGKNRFQKTTAGVYDYSFDDGSIWELKTYENGEQYLVKTVDDENEDNVIRVKKANQSDIIKSEDEIENAIKVILERNKFVVSKQLVSNIKKDIVAKLIQSSSVEESIKEYCQKDSLQGA